MADVTVTITELDDGVAVSGSTQTVTVSDGIIAGGGGAVDSVNGHVGTVVLGASDVGADATGAAAAAQAASQPLDSDLTAIAALSTTTFGRALLTAANTAGLLTLAGLGSAATHASTDFDAAGAASAAQAASQPLDSDLTAIAALTTTSFGRSVLTAADAAGLRTLAALATVAATGAYGDLSGLPTLGTAAAKNVPASGNAATGEVVLGADSRLTDSRTPTAHTHTEADVTGLTADLAAKVPSTRQVNGHALSADVTLSASDVSAVPTTRTVAGHALSADVTLAESDITGLVSDLAAKAPLASPTFTGTPAAPTATAGTNTTQLATTAFVTTAVAAGGGGGGSAFTQRLNLPLSTLTGWTAGTGTWTAGTGVIQQTDTSANTRRLYNNTFMDLVDSWAQVDVRVDTSASTSSTCGLSFGAPSATDGDGAVFVGFKCSTTQATSIYTEVDNIVGGGSIGFTAINNGTWMTLKVHRVGLMVTAWLNGTIIGSFSVYSSSSSAGDRTRLALRTYNTAASFRNLQVWTQTAPF